MNKIKIQYDNKISSENERNENIIKLTLLQKNKENGEFFNISSKESVEENSNSSNNELNDELNNRFENSSFLKSIGINEKEAIVTNTNNNAIEIVGIVPSEINFRNLSKLISQVLAKIRSLSNSSVIQIDVSKYSEGLQKQICICFEYNNYSFRKYLANENGESSENGPNPKKSVEHNLNFNTTLSNEVISKIKINSKNVSYCRDLVNSNASEITCDYLHKEVEAFSKEYNLEFKALVGEELLDERMNLLYQVGKSASSQPRILCAIYRGDSSNKEYSALVGKGITFDTGGINLKPTGAIEDMKLDMGGAATTLSAFKSLVELGVKKNIILVLGCAENSIDSQSYKPGDVFTSRKGISVEITNTDAEGRLALADCMDYIQEKYTINKMIDCATLTGASMVALGLETIAMFSNDNSMARNVYQSSKDAYELMWRLPILDEHREILQSNIANCSNAGSGASRRFGGASSAAAFLEQFVKEGVKWVHLDIAGASFSSKTGASGCGVRTIVEYFDK